MKKIKTLFILFLTAVICTTLLTACIDDENDGGNDESASGNITSVSSINIYKDDSLWDASNTLELTVGATAQFTAEVLPSNATNKTVTWTASNTTYITVSNGLITAKAITNDNSYTVTAQCGDVSKTIKIKVIASAPSTKYTVTVNKSGKGTITGVGEYSAGETVTITAVPNNGYNFSHWYIGYYTFLGGIEKSTSITITFTMPSEDVFLSAHFVIESTPIQYTLTVSMTTGGNTVSGSVIVLSSSFSGSSKFANGETVNLTATAKSGYKFAGWYQTYTTYPYEEKISSYATINFTMPSGNTTLIAKFISA